MFILLTDDSSLQPLALYAYTLALIGPLNARLNGVVLKALIGIIQNILVIIVELAPLQ